MEYEYGSGPSPRGTWSKHWNSGIVLGMSWTFLPSPGGLHVCCMTFLLLEWSWPLGGMIQVVSSKCLLFSDPPWKYRISHHGKAKPENHRKDESAGIISSSQLMSLPPFFHTWAYCLEVDSLTWGGCVCMRVLKMMIMMMMTTNTISLSHEMFARINLGLPPQWITTYSFSAPAAFHFCKRLCRQWRVERYATVDDLMYKVDLSCSSGWKNRKNAQVGWIA